MRALVHLILFAALLALLTGCAMLDLLPELKNDDPAGPEPSYRSIIALRMDQILGTAAPTEALLISGVQRVDSMKGPAWLACLRATGNLLPRHYAIFIQRGRMVASRLSVLIDQCEMQAYMPFDWRAEAVAPVQ